MALHYNGRLGSSICFVHPKGNQKVTGQWCTSAKRKYQKLFNTEEAMVRSNNWYEHTGTLKQLVMKAKQIQMRNKQKFINLQMSQIFGTSYGRKEGRKEGIVHLLRFSG